MDQILHPIIVAFAWIWVRLHDLLVLLGVPSGSGIGWILSIAVLTVIVRLIVLPLYVKQMKSMRMMQVIQPELQKLQEKYKGKTDPVSRQRQSEEMIALYKKSGYSPYASCWPMLVQLPFIFALYRTIYAVEQIRSGSYRYSSLGPLDASIADEINNSSFFGVYLNETFGSAPGFSGKAVFITFTIVMVVIQFLSMYLSMKRNMSQQLDPNNPMMKTQRTMMLYLMPLMYVFTGLVLQAGVMVYTLTTVVFAFIQQYAIIKLMPTPNSPAYFELCEKRSVKYKAWAVPYFEAYQEKLKALQQEGDAEKLESFYVTSLAEVQGYAKKQRVAKKFPEDWEPADQLDIYQNLANDEWTAIPDEAWIVSITRIKRRQAEELQARRKQSRRMSREARMKQRQKEQAQQQAEMRRREREARAAGKSGQSSAAGENENSDSAKAAGLTPAEIERRREERRKQRRQQAKKSHQNRKS